MPRWEGLSDERRALLKLTVVRFALTPKQAARWFNVPARNKGTTFPVTDGEILQNPYRIAETDLGDRDDSPVSLGLVDRGLLPDSTISAKHPVPEPSLVGSPSDSRRVRAAMVSVLREASEKGDSLLSTGEALRRISQLELSHPCLIGSDWPAANNAQLEPVVSQIEIVTDSANGRKTASLQPH